MGARASRPVSRRVPNLVITLDALNTIYRFREPFPLQYSKIAKQCGLKASLAVEDIERSFKQAFKKQNRDFPNYGKGQLENPQKWWNELVLESFKPLVGSEEIPSDLGNRLYNHFSSGSAYELFPDVKPFLDTINNLRTKFSDPDGPMIMLGIITNSDPRVRQVLNSLTLRVGISQLPDTSFSGNFNLASKESAEMAYSGRQMVRSPFFDLYDSKNDFDFLATSYETGYEKPASEAFWAAKRLAGPLPFSRLEQTIEESPSMLQNLRTLIGTAWEARQRGREARWIHIGDDLEKDFRAARAANVEALWLLREPQDESVKVNLPPETVTSLEDAGIIVSLMAQETLKEW